MAIPLGRPEHCSIRFARTLVPHETRRGLSPGAPINLIVRGLLLGFGLGMVVAAGDGLAFVVAGWLSLTAAVVSWEP
jgi:hypothetical protein